MFYLHRALLSWHLVKKLHKNRAHSLGMSSHLPYVTQPVCIGLFRHLFLYTAKEPVLPYIFLLLFISTQKSRTLDVFLRNSPIFEGPKCCNRQRVAVERVQRLNPKNPKP